jgi:hypothetical protein
MKPLIKVADKREVPSIRGCAAGSRVKLLGYLAGWLSFKVKSCPHCSGRGNAVAMQRLSGNAAPVHRFGRAPAGRASTR